MRLALVAACAFAAVVLAPVHPGQAQETSGRLIIFNDSAVEQGRPVILRGSSAPRRSARSSALPETAILAGRTFWAVDPADGLLQACRVRNTSAVNGARIQCLKRRLD